MKIKIDIRNSVVEVECDHVDEVIQVLNTFDLVPNIYRAENMEVDLGGLAGAGLNQEIIRVPRVRP